MRGDWELVGKVSVDAGCVMVGDPCYTVGKPEIWKEFIKRAWPGAFDPARENDETAARCHDCVELPQGVVVPSGYGDGTYKVYVKKNHEGRVIRLLVVFD
jgi:hypothetical protein